MHHFELFGEFDSQYALRDQHGISFVHDCLVFGRDHRSGNVVGRGQPDNEGLTMQVTLGIEGACLRGNWEERDSEGDLIFGGEVEFWPEQEEQELQGIWCMVAEEGVSGGTWTLTKRLGGQAVQASPSGETKPQ